MQAGKESRVGEPTFTKLVCLSPSCNFCRADGIQLPLSRVMYRARRGKNQRYRHGEKAVGKRARSVKSISVASFIAASTMEPSALQPFDLGDMWGAPQGHPQLASFGTLPAV